MRPFYRKDLFRDEIVTINPISHRVKIDSDDIRLETVKMEKGQSITLDSEQYEVGVIILSGTATIQTDEFVAENIGSRKDVFSGKPTAVYIPCETRFDIRATGYGTLEIALCKARTNHKGRAYLIQPEEVKEKVQGVLNWKRNIHEILVGEQTSRLVIGETYGCPGDWAIYPYKEDHEKMIFHFKLSPSQGARVKVMRTEDESKAYFVQDDTTLLVQDTYLPVPEVEEAQVYYLWFKLKR